MYGPGTRFGFDTGLEHQPTFIIWAKKIGPLKTFPSLSSGGVANWP